jgi:6-pyruvoyltetrahydropterin/6-carboxytetrahydropterin synthase
MYSLTISDHFMIAHSLQGAVFGPAQGLHGATYAVEAAFFRPVLDPDNIVVDIGQARIVLHEILAEFNYKNLDDHPRFSERVTTTEFLAHYIFRCIAAAILEGRLGPHAQGVNRVRVTLVESPVARASYEGPLGI